MKKIMLLPFLILALFGNAQKKPPVEYKKAIHFSPFALVTIDYTIMAGAEYRLRPKLALVADAGYIFASSFLADFQDRTPVGSGFIIRPAIRLYHGDRNRFYFQGQLSFKMVTNKKFDWLGKDCVDDIPAYEQLQEFKYRRFVYGLNATAGRLIPMGRKQKLFLDLYLGLGVKYKKSIIVGEPRSHYEPFTIMGTEKDMNNGFFPNAPAGAKLVFVIE